MLSPSFSLRIVLTCGSFRLIYDQENENLWLGSDGKKPADKDSFEVSGPAELFGVGAGEYAEGPAAKDIMSDVQGRWFAFNVRSEMEECIIEADKRLAEHIRSSSIFGKAPMVHRFAVSRYLFEVAAQKRMNHSTSHLLVLVVHVGPFYLLMCLQYGLEVTTYLDAIKELENLGEVNIKLSRHTLDKADSSYVFRADKTVCFTLDPPKESKKRKKVGY